jgi:hypothetical protein
MTSARTTQIAVVWKRATPSGRPDTSRARAIRSAFSVIGRSATQPTKVTAYMARVGKG